MVNVLDSRSGWRKWQHRGTQSNQRFKYCGGFSGKGGLVGSLRSSGGTSRAGLGVRVTQHHILCKLQPHSRFQSHLGTDDPDGSVKDVREGGAAKNIGKTKAMVCTRVSFGDNKGQWSTKGEQCDRGPRLRIVREPGWVTRSKGWQCRSHHSTTTWI